MTRENEKLFFSSEIRQEFLVVHFCLHKFWKKKLEKCGERMEEDIQIGEVKLPMCSDDTGLCIDDSLGISKGTEQIVCVL